MSTTQQRVDDPGDFYRPLNEIPSSLPRENLLRAVDASVEYVERADPQAGGPRIFGHFAVFDQWALIDSATEGVFMERFAAGSLAKSLREGRDRIKCIMRHGTKTPLGELVLGRIVHLEEDSTFEVELFPELEREAPLLMAGLRAGEYSMSFKFRVIKSNDVMRPARSAYNPRGLPERTVTEAAVREFGPCTFAVYEGTALSMRSITDDVVRERLTILDERHEVGRAQQENRLYERSLDYVGSSVWLLEPDSLRTIVGILAERREGHRASPEEIAERIGARAASDEPADTGQKDSVAVIPITGPLVPHGSGMSATSVPLRSAETIQQEVRAAALDPEIGAIMLDINSPGGAAKMIPELAAEIAAAGQSKPVVAMANTLAASGAYWLATAADEIVASPSAEVGSIGAYSVHEDVSAAMEMKGERVTLVSAGKYKVEKNPFEPLDEEARADMQSRVDELYSEFVSAVAKGRGVKASEVRAGFGQGRTVMAKAALKEGMIDRIATRDQTLTRLRKVATAIVDGDRGAAQVEFDAPDEMVGPLSFDYSKLPIKVVLDAERLGEQLAAITRRNGETFATGGVVASARPEAVVPLTHISEPEPSAATTQERAEPEPSEATTHDTAAQDAAHGPDGKEQQVMSIVDGEVHLTIEQVRDRLDSIKVRFQEIHTEFGASVKPDAVNEEIDQLLSERDRLEEAQRDWERTASILESYATREDRRDGSERTGRRIGNGGIHSNVDRHPGVPADIYSLVEYGRLNKAEDLIPALREGAKMAVDRAVFSHPDVEKADQQARIEKLLDTVDKKHGALAELILATGSPTYERAFGKTLMGEGLSPEEERAMSLTTTAGGFAVPYTLDPTLILTSNGVVNPLRAISRVENITVNEWRGLSTAGIAAAYTAEATEATDANPVFAQPTANVEKAQAFIPFSIEIGEDWGQLQSQMARLFADAKDTLEADKFLNGFGHASNVPEGLHTGATVVVSTASATTFTVADLYSLTEALPPRFEPNGRIVGNLKQFNRVRAFDTSGGAALWVQLRDSLPSDLIGYPSYRYSNMTSTIASGATILTFGDFSEFLIVERIGMSIELIPHLFGSSNRFPTGQRGLYAHWRNTSKVLTNKAFVSLKVT